MTRMTYITAGERTRLGCRPTRLASDTWDVIFSRRQAFYPTRCMFDTMARQTASEAGALPKPYRRKVERV